MTFLTVTLVMVRPNPSRVGRDIPGNLGDPAFHVWVLSWGAHAFSTRPHEYFDANTLWPASSTLAHSDLLAPLVVVYGPVRALTGSWALAFNVTVLSLLALSLVTTYCLARWLTRRTGAGLIAAIAFTFSGYTFAHWTHLQLLSLGLLPLSYLLLGRFLEERRRWLALALGAVNAAILWTSAYYGVIWLFSTAVVVGGYLVARRFRPGPGFVSGLGVSFASSGVLMAPALFHYLDVSDARSPELLAEFGLNGRDLITPAPESFLWGWMNPAPGAVEHVFYVGFSVMALAAVGGATLAVRRARQGRLSSPQTLEPPEERVRSLYVLLLMLAGAVAAILAFGPTIRGLPAPYRVFYEYLPGFSGMRVPARFAIVTLLAGAILASLGYAALVRRSWGRSKQAAALGAAVMVILVDLAAPLPWVELPRDDRTLSVYRSLDQRPWGAVVEVPMMNPYQSTAGWAFVEATRMVYSSIDWLPRVNGYSAFVPPRYLEHVETFNSFPSPPSLDRAAELEVRYVVLHVGTTAGKMSEHEASTRLRSLPPGASARRYGDSWLVDLAPTSSPSS